MAGSRLFEASSVVDVILGEGGADVDIDIVFDEHLLDLTTYDVANAIWGIGVADDRMTGALIADALEILRRLDREVLTETAAGDELEGRMEVARATGLTFYDAAYLATAEREDLTLVTEDGALAEAAAIETWTSQAPRTDEPVANGRHAAEIRDHLWIV